MIVTISEDVFIDESYQLALLAMIQLGFEERHLLLCDPPYPSPAVARWLETLPRSVADQIDLTLESSNEAASRAGSRRIRVEITDACRWIGPEPVLDPSTALRLLRTPLKLVVEDRRNEAAFVRRMATPALRARFEQVEKAGWIEFEHGGGLGGMKHRIYDVKDRPLLHTRLWMMFDHDGKEPETPGEASEELWKLCQEITNPWPLKPQRLDRRTIENYLPTKSLWAWALRRKGSNAERRRRRKLARTFMRLSPMQRACYNMKDGLRGDLDKEGNLPALFRDLLDAERSALHRGFGDGICNLFHKPDGPLMHEDWLRQEVPASKREALIQSIFERL
jgi:hypothetical protein